MSQLELRLPVSIEARRAGGSELPVPDGRYNCKACARELGRRRAVMPMRHAGLERWCLVCGTSQPHD